MNSETLEEIFERYFESSTAKVQEDTSQIINFMIKTRKLKNIFNLLENERKRTIDNFSKTLSTKHYEPFLIWKIQSEIPNLGYYKESESFSFEGYKKVDFVLINYYNFENDVFNIAIKLSDDKLALDRMTNLSILSLINIKEINFKSKINFNCIVFDQKSKVLLCKIEKFSSFFKNSFNNINFTIEIYFHISHNFSAIISHICDNFYQYYTLPNINIISKNVMNLIIRNKSLNNKSEDEKIIAVINWSKLKNYFRIK